MTTLCRSACFRSFAARHSQVGTCVPIWHPGTSPQQSKSEAWLDAMTNVIVPLPESRNLSQRRDSAPLFLFLPPPVRSSTCP